MLLAHGRLEIGGSHMLGMRLVGTPLHEQTVAEAAEQTGHEHGRGAANAAAVVVVRNVQPLVQAIFDAAKARPVEFQPLLGLKFVRPGAGQQRDLFVLAAWGLAEHSGRLGHQREAPLLRGDPLGAD